MTIGTQIEIVNIPGRNGQTGTIVRPINSDHYVIRIDNSGFELIVREDEIE